MLLNKFLDIAGAKTGHFSEAYAWQARLLTGDVVIYPALADAKPGSDVGDGQQAFWIAEFLPIRLGRGGHSLIPFRIFQNEEATE
jgi:hypothetical protein